MLRAWAPVGVVAAAGALVGGCILFQGGTDGYGLAPGGEGATCTKPADCSSMTCCYEVPDSGAPTGTCQQSCGEAYEQACSNASDCGDGGACVANECTAEGVSATVNTCGAIPVLCTQ